MAALKSFCVLRFRGHPYGRIHPAAEFPNLHKDRPTVGLSLLNNETSRTPVLRSIRILDHILPIKLVNLYP